MRANALHRAGQLKEAEVLYRKLLRQFPSDCSLSRELARLLVETERYAEAIPFLEKPVQLGKASADDLNNLGYAHFLNGTFELGVEPLLEANARQPHSCHILFNLGRTYLKMEDHKQAVSYLEQACGINGAPDNVRLLLATALADLGEFARARELNEECLRDPAIRPWALLNLAALRKQTKTDNVLERILAELGKENAPDARIILHQAAAKTYLDLQESDDAFMHLKKGKSLRAVKFNRQQFLEAVECSKVCSVLVAELPRRQYAQTAPVFIVGMPRSGSSLTEQILSGHPGLFGTGERQYITKLAHRLGYTKTSPKAYRDSIRRLTQSALADISKDYYSQIGRTGLNEERSLDKFLHNFLHVGLIKVIFPDAKFIHCRRQPLDCCFSIFSNPLNEGHSYADDLTDLGWYYRHYENLMAHWHSSFPNDILDASYEDTVQNIEASARHMLEFLGLPWNPAVLDYTENEKGTATMSKWQVRQPLYSSSIDRWKPHEKHLGPLIEALKG